MPTESVSEAGADVRAVSDVAVEQQSHHCSNALDGAAGPAPMFVKTFLGVPDSVATDSAGNIFITGAFVDSLDFGNGPRTSAGKEDAYLVKLDPMGSPIWLKTFGTNEPDEGMLVEIDIDGNVVLVGASPSSIDLGGGPLPSSDTFGYYAGDSFVARFTSSGQYLSSKRLPVSTRGLAIHERDVVIFSLAISTTPALELAHLSPGFGTLWNDTVHGAAYPSGILADTEGVTIGAAIRGPIQVGTTSTTASGSVFFANVDWNGNVASIQTAGCKDRSDDLWALAKSRAGFLATGRFALACGNDPTLVSKHHRDGSILWSAEAKGYAFGAAVVEDGRENAFVTGRFLETVTICGRSLVAAAGADVFVAKLDPSGDLAFVERFGGTEQESGTGVVVDPSGALVTVGYFSGTVDFGTGPITVPGNGGYLMKFAP